MNGRERFQSLLARHEADRPGFWLGNPHEDTVPIYLNHFKVANQRELATMLGDDFTWAPADFLFWKHPEGKPPFDVTFGQQRISHNQAGVFAECEDASQVDRHPVWLNANPDYLDLDAMEVYLDQQRAAGLGIASGMWSHFFHNFCDFFGMENCFVKMYTDPDVVDAVTEHVVDFYMEANKRIFDRMADRIDTYFLGNDFGTQLDMLISPELFRRFVLPSFKRLIDLAKSYGLKVMLHSCGAIGKAIPMLIDAGVDALHPLQAKAAGMDAQTLSQYKSDLLFVGGIDTQQLLPFGKPEDVRREVRRIRDIFGSGWVVSPSHEALLPNVPVENVLAMRDAAMEG